MYKLRKNVVSGLLNEGNKCFVREASDDRAISVGKQKFWKMSKRKSDQSRYEGMLEV